MEESESHRYTQILRRFSRSELTRAINDSTLIDFRLDIFRKSANGLEWKSLIMKQNQWYSKNWPCWL